MVVAIVPASTVLSNQIEENYQVTIQQTIDDANRNSANVQKRVGATNDENVIEKIFSKVKGGL